MKLLGYTTSKAPVLSHFSYVISTCVEVAGIIYKKNGLEWTVEVFLMPKNIFQLQCQALLGDY